MRIALMHRIGIVGPEIVTADYLRIRESPAPKHRMSIVETAVTNGHRCARSTICLTNSHSIRQGNRLRQRPFKLSNRRNMGHNRILKKFLDPLNRNLTGEAREVLVLVRQTKLGLSQGRQDHRLTFGYFLSQPPYRLSRIPVRQIPHLSRIDKAHDHPDFLLAGVEPVVNRIAVNKGRSAPKRTNPVRLIHIPIECVRIVPRTNVAIPQRQGRRHRIMQISARYRNLSTVHGPVVPDYRVVDLCNALIRQIKTAAVSIYTRKCVLGDSAIRDARTRLPVHRYSAAVSPSLVVRQQAVLQHRLEVPAKIDAAARSIRTVVRDFAVRNRRQTCKAEDAAALRTGRIAAYCNKAVGIVRVGQIAVREEPQGLVVLD